MIKLAVVVGDSIRSSYLGRAKIVEVETGEELEGVLDVRWVMEGGCPPRLEVTIHGVVSWSVEEWERRVAEWRDRQSQAPGLRPRRVVGLEG